MCSWLHCGPWTWFAAAGNGSQQKGQQDQQGHPWASSHPLSNRSHAVLSHWQVAGELMAALVAVSHALVRRLFDVVQDFLHRLPFQSPAKAPARADPGRLFVSHPLVERNRKRGCGHPDMGRALGDAGLLKALDQRPPDAAPVVVAPYEQALQPVPPASEHADDFTLFFGHQHNRGTNSAGNGLPVLDVCRPGISKRTQQPVPLLG